MNTNNNYEDKKQTRIDRYRDRAAKAKGKSGALHDEARRMASIIPFGQPIMVGHHSESRDRNFRNRIHNKFGQAAKESDKAEYYETKAKTAENNTAISSDDPEAVTKLKVKIEKAEKLQGIMKAVNKVVKSKKLTDQEKVDKIHADFGLQESTVWKLLQPDFCGRIGFPGYELTNNNANIRRMKKRLESLQEAVQAEHKETEYNGFQVIENPEENRIQIFFDGKEAYLNLCKSKGINLRSYGFKYSRYSNAWQRHLNNAGRYAAEQVTAKMAM